MRNISTFFTLQGQADIIHQIYPMPKKNVKKIITSASRMCLKCTVTLTSITLRCQRHFRLMNVSLRRCFVFIFVFKPPGSENRRVVLVLLTSRKQTEGFITVPLTDL